MPTQSRKQYLAKRDARIYELWTHEGLEPREITTALLGEDTLRSESDESAIRTVRGVVARIRKRLDSARTGDASPSIATNEIDALERKLGRLRDDLAWQLAVSADESTVMHVMTTPNGEVVIEKARWPAGVRQKARKDAGLLAEKIAELEMVLAAKRSVAEERGVDDRASGGLVIVESESSIPELIKKNLDVN